MEPMFTREQLYSTQGHMKTRSIFQEANLSGEVPLLSLRSGSHRTYPSLYDLYVKYCVDDPSEVVFAETVFGDVAYWEAVKKQKWFAPWLKEYRYIADVKRKSKAFQAIIKEVTNDGKNSYAAAKYLIEEPWKQKRTKAAKEESRATTEEALISSEVSEDLDRLREAGLLN